MDTTERKFDDLKEFEPSTPDETHNSAHEETIKKLKRRHISCPPGRTLNKIITNGVIGLTTWIIFWSLSGPEALPGGNIFGVLVIFYSALVGRKFIELITIPSMPPLPPLFGMLLAGFIIRNVPFISEHVHVHNTWSSALRSTALTIILLRAGLGLDPEVLKQLKNVCLRLSFGPCIIEACATALVSHFIMNFPWQWGFLLGFLVGAVSPAVVVPSMLFLQENGYGTEKGIPTLLIAASSVDDIMAISGFNTFMSIIFSSGGVLHNIISSLSEIIIGMLIGTIMGVFAQYFPSGDEENLSQKRAFLLLCMCISVVLGSQHIGLHGFGGLCTLMSAFIAGRKWSKEKIGVQKNIAHAWNMFQPLLFGLVGSEIDVSSLEPNTIGICAATLHLALCARVLSTFVLVSCAGFTVKEKIFIALAWIPKATVQAVLGPLALERARLTAPHLEVLSKEVLTVAFLAILITAPNGALLIGMLGPKILHRHRGPSKIQVELSGFLDH